MNQDELLDDLGRLARAQAEQTAAREGDVADLLRPLDAAAHDRIVARLLPLVRAEAPDVRPEVQPDVQPGRAGEPAAMPRVEAPPAEVRPRPARTASPRRSWSRRWAMAAPALAAAAVLLWFVWPRAGASLPVYVAELSGGRAVERGADADAIIRVGPGDRVSAVLRPATAVSDAVSVRVFVDGRALADLGVERSADGALRVSGLGPALAALAPGRHRLWFAVGRPEVLPEVLPDEPPAGDARPDVQLLSYEVERIQP
jgi:hypothetical protein